MAKGGARHKMNLDISPEQFSKYSLRQQNELLNKMAKRYNQRIKTFYKVDPYHALKIYEYNEVEVGKPVFSRKKALSKEEAKERFYSMYNFNRSKYSSISKYRDKIKESTEQLAKNVGLPELNEDDKKALSGFFEYVYTELKMDKDIYNYRELGDFYDSFKLTDKEQGDRKAHIKEMWKAFQKSKEDLASFELKVKQEIKKRVDAGDERPLSQIMRESVKGL